jgi:hypothetical protein
VGVRASAARSEGLHHPFAFFRSKRDLETFRPETASLATKEAAEPGHGAGRGRGLTAWALLAEQQRQSGSRGRFSLIKLPIGFPEQRASAKSPAICYLPGFCG